MSSSQQQTQCPPLQSSEEDVTENPAFRSKCLIGVLIDKKLLSLDHMQEIVSAAWRLQGSVQVIRKENNIYIFQFSNCEDQEFLLGEKVLAVKSRILFLQQWKPDMNLSELKVEKVPLWFQFWGLPLEYYCTEVATQLGNMAGEVQKVEQNARNILSIRVRVYVNPDEPLSMGCFVKLDNGRDVWVQYSYERLFRMCNGCGRIGHKAKDCDWDIPTGKAALHARKQRLQDKFGVDYMIQSNHQPHFVDEAMAFSDEVYSRTTRIQIHRTPSGLIYAVRDR